MTALWWTGALSKGVPHLRPLSAGIGASLWLNLHRWWAMGCKFWSLPSNSDVPKNQPQTWPPHHQFLPRYIKGTQLPALAPTAGNGQKSCLAESTSKKIWTWFPGTLLRYMLSPVGIAVSNVCIVQTIASSCRRRTHLYKFVTLLKIIFGHFCLHREWQMRRGNNMQQRAGFKPGLLQWGLRTDKRSALYHVSY